MHFQYGDTEMEYLKSRDGQLGAVINRLGYIERNVDGNLFSSVIHSIVGQQISTKAQRTIWQRMRDAYGWIDIDSMKETTADELHSFGMSYRKAEYISDFIARVSSGELDLETISDMPDEEAIEALTSIRGVGRWTAEMILLFCLQRPDILSFDDLAIRRGMRMVYQQEEIDRNLFGEYRKRLSPYGSIASFYFWEVSGGAIPELRDPAPKQDKKKNK